MSSAASHWSCRKKKTGSFIVELNSVLIYTMIVIFY